MWEPSTGQHGTACYRGAGVFPPALKPGGVHIIAISIILMSSG